MIFYNESGIVSIHGQMQRSADTEYNTPSLTVTDGSGLPLIPENKNKPPTICMYISYDVTEQTFTTALAQNAIKIVIMRISMDYKTILIKSLHN